MFAGLRLVARHGTVHGSVRLVRLSSTSLHGNIRDAFRMVQNSLSIVNQGNRHEVAQKRASELAKELEDEEIWTKDYSQAAKKHQHLSQLQKLTTTLTEVQNSYDSLQELSALADSSKDADLQKDVLSELLALQKRAQELTKTLLFSEPADGNGAYIDIKAGSGGTEACDLADILARAYTRWAQSHDFSVQIVDDNPGDVAGIRSRTLLVDGPYAYGLAQFESGIHRFVRNSPFDSSGLRHTSFVSVQVSPYFGEEEEEGTAKGVEINPSDLKIQTMRSSGAGGQHVNKTESAVRITHIPSGIVVACQQERSQPRNKALAISLLKSRLFDMERLKKAQSKANQYSDLPEMTWGSQIRSYTLQPYQLIKDTRTGFEVSSGGVQDVLDGDFDGFMEAALKHFRTPRELPSS